MRAIRFLAVSLSLVLVVAACRGESDTQTTTTTTTTTTSTTAPTTTTAPEPLVSIALEGAPAGLAGAVRALYEWVADPDAGPAPRLPSGLVEHLSEVGPVEGAVEVEGTVSTGSILESDIAVVEAGDDVVLAVADRPDRWRVVGAHLARFESPAWYGTSPRLALIIGSDARPGQNPLGYRADSLHVVASVPASGEGAIVGIPRDSWVEAPYGRNDKFTNVMASRGPEVVLETARTTTGLPLEGYLVTGFSGFVGLVDAFEGFEFEVPFGMADPASQAYFRAGLQMFTGTDALAFARNRTIPGGDFTRSHNHGLLMLGALAKVRDLGFAELPRLLEILTEFTWTDFTAEDLLTLAASAYLLDPEDLPNIVAEGTVGTAGQASVVFLTDAAYATFEDLADGVLDETLPPDEETD